MTEPAPTFGTFALRTVPVAGESGRAIGTNDSLEMRASDGIAAVSVCAQPAVSVAAAIPPKARTRHTLLFIRPSVGDAGERHTSTPLCGRIGQNASCLKKSYIGVYVRNVRDIARITAPRKALDSRMMRPKSRVHRHGRARVGAARTSDVAPILFARRRVAGGHRAPARSAGERA